MAVGDIYEVKSFFNIGSEVTMTVCHMREKVVSTDDIPAETVAAIMYNILDTHINTNLFSAETHVTLIQARRIKPTAGVPATLIVGSALFPLIEGAGAGDPLPSTSAALISLYTETFTKNGRGRNYWPGVASGTQNDGQLIEASLTLLTAFAAEFKAVQVAVGPGTGEWEFCVYSRELGTAAIVEQVIGHSNLATQRRRRNHPGVGT